MKIVLSTEENITGMEREILIKILQSDAQVVVELGDHTSLINFVVDED